MKEYHDKRFNDPKYSRRTAGIAALALFAYAVYAVHDMQLAEGVGLYFALKLGKERLLFDIIVDILAASGLLLLISLPCLFLKHRKMEALLRFLLVFLSFMPALSMAYLLHPLQAEAEISIELSASVLQMVLPFLCLLAVTVQASSSAALSAVTEKSWKRWYSVCCAGAAILFAVTLFIPSLQQLFYFILIYLLLLICFDLWERLYLKYPSLDTWGRILFGGLTFRAFYVLSEVLRRY